MSDDCIEISIAIELRHHGIEGEVSSRGKAYSLAEGSVPKAKVNEKIRSKGGGDGKVGNKVRYRVKRRLDSSNAL